jgi:DNA invertase Pin-like site-specific DNA recombinase
MRRAFSYARFSSPEQMEGRSLRRQEEGVKGYCARHGLTLDERSFTDLGVSAYHGANAEVGELGVFLAMLGDGRIPKRSVLVVENLDRLTRLPDPQKATKIITDIVDAGVDVVTVSPETVYTQANIRLPQTWIPLQCQLALAADESRKKSERVADAWADKRATAAEVKLTKKGPAWLRITADRKGWVVLEERAAWVRRMFALAAEGYGAARIAGVLHRECPDGFTGKGWQPNVILSILRSRSVLGEYQPHAGTCAKKGRKSTRTPVGEPVKAYFPAIVSEADFYRAQQALDGRRKGGGRVTGTPNLFNGLLYDALDGRRMTVNAAHARRVLVSSGAIRKVPGSRWRSVRYDVFEEAVLTSLAELRPADVLGKRGEAADRVAELTGRLTAVNRKLDAVRARAAEEDDVSVFLDLLADLDRQRVGLIGELEKARADAANQQGENLGEFTSLVKLLDDAEEGQRDALRAKARAALRRVVKEMRAVVVPRGRDRLVALQVWFHGGRHRDYLIYHRSPRANFAGREEGCWWARSGVRGQLRGELDLRDPAQARQLAEALAGADVEALAGERRTT